jgi:O-antigen/teichoic acid export membrane protein
MKLSSLRGRIPIPGVARNALIYVGATALNAAIPFLLLPFLTRWLSPAEFGVMGMFVSIVTVLGTVIGLSTHGFISVAYYQLGQETMPRYVTASLIVLALSTAVLALVGLAAYPLIARATGIDHGWLWAVLVAAAGQFVITIGLAVFQTWKRAYSYAAIQIGNSVVLTVLTVAFILGLHMSWTGRALAQAVAGAGMAAIVLLLLTRAGGIRYAWDSEALKRALNFGVTLVPHSLAAVVLLSADRLIIGNTVGAEPVGYYHLAMQFGSVLTVFSSALNLAWLPWLYERLARNTPEADLEIVRLTSAILGLIALAVLAMALLAPLLIGVVAGPKFAAAAHLLPIIAVALGFYAMYPFVVGVLFYESRTKTISTITVSITLLYVPAVTVMSRIGGVEGGAFAVLGCFALYTSVVWWFAQRVRPLPWFSALLYRRSASNG